MQKIPMTPKGYKKLHERLKYIKSVERPQVIEAIEVARGHGDLSENADYDAAKEHQLQLSEEIRKIEHEISLAEVIEPSTLNHEKIVFGATVTLTDVETEEELCYQIVGTCESDIKQKKISIESPIARALIGKSPGDLAKVKTPKGIRELEILNVEYK